MEWLLDIVLIVLLAATLFHALRLERALGVLKRDRATLQELITGFNASTQAAEQGVGRLRAAADGAGRTLARQIEAAQSLRQNILEVSPQILLRISQSWRYQRHKSRGNLVDNLLIHHG